MMKNTKNSVKRNENISNDVKTLKEDSHMVQLKKKKFVEEKISKLNYKDVSGYN